MHTAFMVLYVWKGARTDEKVVFGPRFADLHARVQLADGAPALDARAALREDANAIDRLCRLALRRTTTGGVRRGCGTGARLRRRTTNVTVAADGTFDAPGGPVVVHQGPREHARSVADSRAPVLRPAPGMTAPRVSVVMPAFNEAEILGHVGEECRRGSARPRRHLRGARRRERIDRRHARHRRRGSRSEFPEVRVEAPRRSRLRARAPCRAAGRDRRRGRQLRHRLLRPRLPRRGRRRRSSRPTAPPSSSAPSGARARRDTRDPLRKLATQVFSTILRVVFGLRVSDTHGIKAMRRAAVEPYARICTFGQDLFDTELILRVERAGLRTAEIPVSGARAAPGAQLVPVEGPAYAARSVPAPLGVVEGISGASGSLTLRAGRILYGDGGQSASPAWVTITDGRIVATGAGAGPAGSRRSRRRAARARFRRRAGERHGRPSTSRPRRWARS